MREIKFLKTNAFSMLAVASSITHAQEKSLYSASPMSGISNKGLTLANLISHLVIEHILLANRTGTSLTWAHI